MNFTKILFLCGLAISTYSPSYSQTKTSSKAIAQLLPLDPDVKIGKLANGFTYYIRKNTEPKNRAYLYLANKVGSILENEDQQGLAHFVEHMGFNGTKHYPKNDLVSYLQKAGVRFGADLNAYTSFDETVYQLPIPTDDAEIFKNGMQMMRDWAQDATLDPVEVDKERGVFLEEKRLGKGAYERMQIKYLPVLFNNSRYSNRLPIGTEEVLENFKPETLRQFYKDWYRPNLQALIVVGDIDVQAVEQMIKAKFADLKNPVDSRERIEYTIPLIHKNQFIAVTDKEFPFTVAQIMIKHPETVAKTTVDLRDNMIRALYNQMLNARFSEITKQANPPFLQGGSDIHRFLAGLDVAGSFVVAKPGELETGFKAVLTEVERVKRFGFTQTEFERAKVVFMIQEESTYKEKDKTNSESFVNEYLQHFLRGEAGTSIPYKYNFYKEKINGIELAEVNMLVKKYITNLNRDVLIMAPEKDENQLPNETIVNTWIKDVEQGSVTAYVDQVSNKPLLAAKAKSGKISAEKKDKDLGITELVLSNGVKVVLKPTNFKNDEISFEGFSPGGTSLYSDADFQSANHAATIMGQSGVGEFNSIALSKFLAGKRVSVQPSISERSESIMGNTTPQDFKTALQLVYLYFTQPRKDEEIFKGYITQLGGYFANRGDDPYDVFSDTVAAVLGNYSIRRTGPSLEKVAQINLDRAYSIFKERFADASDFTFTFVGNFKPQAIKPLLEEYLGALPTISRSEEAKDLGIKTPSGKINKAIYKGIEPKASVHLVFSGDYVYNRANTNQLNALASVLTIKLTERLREDESGVYGVGASVICDKYPQGHYRFNVSFDCGPENVEKLIASTLDEINKIKLNGAQEADVQKFLAEQKRTTEIQLKENNFWLGYLSGQLQNKEDARAILTYLQSLKMVSSESLKAAANTYVSGTNMIRFVLLPETDNKNTAQK